MRAYFNMIQSQTVEKYTIKRW